MSAAIAVIGHNNPPEPTPFDIASEAIEEVYAESLHWLDGGEVTTPEEHDAVDRLLNLAKAARDAADKQRQIEKRPHDKAAKEVQTKYAPLLSRAEMVAEGCKAALTGYRVRLDAEKRAVAEAARREADRQAEAAQAALRATQLTDLAAREAAEALVKEAQDARKAAAKAEKPTATGLRTSYRAEVTEPVVFARHVWQDHHDELVVFLETIATRLVREGFRQLPGVVVHVERSAW